MTGLAAKMLPIMYPVALNPSALVHGSGAFLLIPADLRSSAKKILPAGNEITLAAEH